MRCRGLSQRVRAPRAAARVTAPVTWAPRRREHRPQARGFHPPVAVSSGPPEPCGVSGARPDVSLPGAGLDRWGPDCLAPPPRVGRTPGGPARRADVLPQAERLGPTRGGLEIAGGIPTRPVRVTTGSTRNRGDGGEVARAHQAGPADGAAAVAVDPLPGLLGEQGGRGGPTATALWGESAGAPRAARAGVSDQNAGRAFGWQAADPLTGGTRSRPEVPAGDDRGVAVLGDISARDRVLMDLHADVARARLGQGGAPMFGGSGVDLRRLWLVAGSPAVRPEVSLPTGSHSV
jgi:hypothetical protein